MPYFALRDANFEGEKGNGYVFSKKIGRAEYVYQGVFYPMDEDLSVEEHVESEDPVSFEGILYHRDREKKVTCQVNPQRHYETGIGTCIAFDVVELA